MRFLVSLGALFICGCLWAADFVVPQQKIEVVGGEPVAIGELIVVKVSDIGDRPKHLQSISYTWKIFDFEDENLKENHKIKIIGDEVVLGTGCAGKKVLAEVAISYLFVVKDTLTISEIATKTNLLHKIIQVGDEKPEPPNPKPNPDPQPEPLPNGKYGLAKFAFETSIAKVDNKYLYKGASALAKSFASISAAIAAKKIISEREVLEKTLESNSKALDEAGVPSSMWQGWSLALQDKLFELYSVKKLASVEEYRIAWAEISTGLSALAGREQLSPLMGSNYE